MGASAAPQVAKPLPVSLHKQAQLEALDFFESEKDIESEKKLVLQIFNQTPPDIDLVLRALQSIVVRKDRQRLLDSVKLLVDRFECSSLDSGRSKLCEALRDRWENRLVSLVYYEDTSAKLLQARLMLKKKECRQAADLLGDVRAKEGVFLELLQIQLQAQQCLSDSAALSAIQKDIGDLNVFASVGFSAKGMENGK